MPESKGAIIRTVLESLALEYRSVAEQIERLTGKDYPIIHIIGGGTQNKLLNQFAANATGRKRCCGPSRSNRNWQYPGPGYCDGRDFFVG